MNLRSERQAQDRFLRGLALHQQGNLTAAMDLYAEARSLFPEHFDAVHLSGLIYAQTGNPHEAIDLFRRALSINPRHPIALNNLGSALHETQQHDVAIETLTQALQLKPDYAQAYYNRGNAYSALGQDQSAVLDFEQATKLAPTYADAFANGGNSYKLLRRPALAIAWYDKAIALNPSLAAAHYNKGVALAELELFSQAVDSYSAAIALKPDYIDAIFNRAIALQEMGLSEDALRDYERVSLLKPDYPYLEGSALHLKMHLCRWEGFESAVASLCGKLGTSNRVSAPFPLLALTDSLEDQQLAARSWMHDRHPTNAENTPFKAIDRHTKIRVAYFSADFHSHATSYLMAELFALHDKSRFEIHAFSFGPDDSDAMRDRIKSAFDQFHDVRFFSDFDVARLSRDLHIDIAVDLKGFTRSSRPSIFTHRAAPIQVSYLGYPGTMGTSVIDYLIADRTLIPDEATHLYDEKIVFLPNSYQVNDPKRVISEHRYTRADMNLPVNGFVFCSFNNNYKITPAVFASWMRILNQVEGSVLWLLVDNPTAATNLKLAAARHNVAPDRLILANRLPLAEHLSRHRLADLFVDTFPCCAHTTASDALWAGLPVLTRPGNSFASRVAASLLCAMDLQELITTTEAQFEALAIELANNPDKLANIREKLAIAKQTSPLFNTPLFTKHLESAYQMMHGRHVNGLAKAHISILPE